MGDKGVSCVHWQLVPLRADIPTPCRAKDGDLGFDFFAAESCTVMPNQVVKIPTGYCGAFSSEFGLVFRDRSSVATKKGLTVVGGVIDSGYRGEYIVALVNVGTSAVTIERGDKIAQGVFVPRYKVVQELLPSPSFLPPSERADTGFGSSGQ